jgi:hypothetical protein
LPTVFREGPYRFFFYSDEGHEPMHVHVERGNDEAKLWLDDVISLVYNFGFRRNEISEIRNLIVLNRSRIERRWNEYFSR